MIIAVGSTNPVKINAVKKAFKKVFPDVKIRLKSIDVDSGVSDQPRSDKEAIQGAKNRARLAADRLSADFGFGLEGSVTEVEGQLFMTGWVAVYHQNKFGLAGAGLMEIPDKVTKELKETDKELGVILDELLGLRNIKKKNGAIGIFTQDLVTRESAFEITCITALVKFSNPQHYN